jgi:hypothetical protein
LADFPQLETSPKNWKGAVSGAFRVISQILSLLPCIIALPGIVLHLPIAILTKAKALSVANQSAARSDVKIEGRDVIASTKVSLLFYYTITKFR